MALSGPFRVQGRFEGENCWIDGEGEQVDTQVEADPENGIVETLVLDGLTDQINSRPEEELLPYICQRSKGAGMGNRLFILLQSIL